MIKYKCIKQEQSVVCLTAFFNEKIPDGFSLLKRVWNWWFFLSGERLMTDATCIIQEELTWIEILILLLSPKLFYIKRL